MEECPTSQNLPRVSEEQKMGAVPIGSLPSSIVISGNDGGNLERDAVLQKECSAPAGVEMVCLWMYNTRQLSKALIEKGGAGCLTLRSIGLGHRQVREWLL